MYRKSVSPIFPIHHCSLVIQGKKQIWPALLYNNVHESFDKRQASSYKSTSLPSPTGQCYVLQEKCFQTFCFGFLCKVGRVRAVLHGECHKYHTEWLMDHSVMTLTVSLEVASNNLSNPRRSSSGTIK